MLAKKRLLVDYKIERTIGEGAFSKVKLGVSRHKNGEKVAIKIIKKETDNNNTKSPNNIPQNSKSNLPNLSKEVKLLMRLSHPNVIKLHQVIDTSSEVFIVMEYAAGGELIDYIAAKGKLEEKEGRRLFRQLISALDHCHLAGVVHRDLKLENLLLTAEKNLLLSDFGLGRMISGRNHYLETFCGTPLYAAPELVSGIRYYGPSADIWSTGIVLYIMIAGKPPFRCDNISELYKQINAVKYACPKHFSKELQNLLSGILVKDPRARMTMDDLRMDIWININESQIPHRVLPKVRVSNGEISQEDEQKFIPFIEKHEEYTAFLFGDLAEAKLKTSAESPKHLEVPDAGNRLASRRMSSGIMDALSRFNPFSSSISAPVSPSSPTNDSGAKPPGSDRRRAQSVDITAMGAAIPQLSPIQPAAVNNLAAVQPTHQRRHSLAPGSAMPSTRSSNENVSDSPQRSPNGSISRSDKNSQNHASDTLVNTLGIDKPSNPVAVKKAASTFINTPQRAQMHTSRPFITVMNQISEDGNVEVPQGSAGSIPSKLAKSPISADKRNRRPSIIESIGFHTHSGYSDEIRSVRYSTSLHTTSTLAPAEICAQLENLLNDRQLLPNLQVEKRSKYVWVCKSEDTNFDGKFVMEVEVVSVWLLKMHAIKLKRLGGDALNYKTCYDRIIESLHW